MSNGSEIHHIWKGFGRETNSKKDSLSYNNLIVGFSLDMASTTKQRSSRIRSYHLFERMGMTDIHDCHQGQGKTSAEEKDSVIAALPWLEFASSYTPAVEVLYNQEFFWSLDLQM